jgi:hypothetical protein
MTTKNPFPGMNPFFEQRWQDAHTMLIAYIRDALQERLPADLVAGAEAELVAIGANADAAKFRPDVSVKKPWENSGGGGVAVAAPVRAPQATLPRRFFADDEIERWIEIHDETGQLVTVIELLSPSNKMDESARERYRNKRGTLISAGVNVVEIDLVREGGSVFPKAAREYMQDQGIPYGVCVFRDTQPKESEFYAIGLRDPLPVISIPLRPTDADIPLELQPLIDQCHERGRYHRLRYRVELDPPLSPADAAWAGEILRQHELL